jgi:hypothetical protein
VHPASNLCPVFFNLAMVINIESELTVPQAVISRTVQRSWAHFFTFAAVKVMPTLIAPWYELFAVTTLYLAGFISDLPFSIPMLITSVMLILQ